MAETDEFKEGYDAYNDKLALYNNPYEEDTESHFQWDQGYCQALDDAKAELEDGRDDR